MYLKDLHLRCKYHLNIPHQRLQHHCQWPALIILLFIRSETQWTMPSMTLSLLLHSKGKCANSPDCLPPASSFTLWVSIIINAAQDTNKNSQLITCVGGKSFLAPYLWTLLKRFMQSSTGSPSLQVIQVVVLLWHSLRQWFCAHSWSLVRRRELYISLFSLTG